MDLASRVGLELGLPAWHRTVQVPRRPTLVVNISVSFLHRMELLAIVAHYMHWKSRFNKLQEVVSIVLFAVLQGCKILRSKDRIYGERGDREGRG